MKSFASSRFLLVGGTTKAATTALFFYLADHPRVCASSMKETRFFLDRDYPLQARYRYADGLVHYADYFTRRGADDLLLEATPDYLYSRDAARFVAKELPRARMLFVLRDPVDRLVSWYRFARQTGELEVGLSFDAFIQRQVDGDPGPGTPQVYRGLEQGRYSRYLPGFLEPLGTERVSVMFFEDFRRSPELFMQRVCRFSGLSADLYRDYEFKPHNETVAVRNAGLYRHLRRTGRFIRSYTHRSALIHPPLQKLRRGVDRLFKRPAAERDDLRVGAGTLAFLQNYYHEEASRIFELCGQAPAWSLQLPAGIEED